MITRYAVTTGGRTRAVELEDVDGKLRVVVDGSHKLLDARALGGGVWSLLDGSSVRLVQVSQVGPHLTVEVSHPDGEPRTCTADVTDARADAAMRGGRAAESGPLTLRAPIPGRLVKVLVKAGERVTSGQALLVLEAMKMENELRAPRAGMVAAVHVAEGIAVETGQELVTLA